MKFHSRPGVLALLASVSSVPLAGQAGTVSDKLEELVIISSRVPTPLRQIGTSVSVVTRADIEQLGYNSLYNILRTQPGVGVSNQGGPGGITSLRIRGEQNYRTRFYLDGIDISDTSSPQTTTRMEQILSAGVQRVEILRGPQGLMYGADAGGVVNITTIAPGEGIKGSLTAEGGRYQTQQYAGNLNGGNDRLDFSLSAADYESDLYNARTIDTDGRDKDGYENTTFHGRLGWNIAEGLRLSLVGRDVDAESAYDGCFTVATFESSNACTDEFEQQSWRAALNYQDDNFSQELFYTNNETGRDNFTRGQFAFGLHGELERAGYLGSYSASDALEIVYGVDLLRESIDEGGDDRDQTAYLAEYRGGFKDRIFITAGARHDDNDDFGSHTTYRVSGAYLIPVASGEVKLRAAYGTGFRAPSLFEISNNSYSFEPLPDLNEEETEGYDVALSWTDGTSVLLELVYFDQEITDEIFWQPSTFAYLQKTGDTQSEGIELFGQWQLSNTVSVNGNYTYTDSKDINGEQRARRPEQLANLGINWHGMSKRLTLGIQARLSRDAIDVDGADLDNYEVIDLNATYNMTDKLDIYGRVENLTDKDYEEVPTYNTGGAAGYLGVRYSF